jgi:NAD(P)-dependent dehydrogenase (short-subunit alcohol dehydrogenase family)
MSDLRGKVALVTGANSGIGYWTALHLARSGAHVVLGCRSHARASVALGDLRAAVPEGSFEVLALDLADLAAVRASAKEFVAGHDRLDVLVNNAGVALAPHSKTVDGFESHLGTNFLGHFALTGLLIDLLEATPQSRVVQVGSLAHRYGTFRFDDPQFENRRYTSMLAYSQSKLANVVHMLELGRRLERAGASTISVGAHPGAAATGIVEHTWIVRVPKARDVADWLGGRVLNLPELGAEPSIRAATDPGIANRTYLGPGGLFEVKGPVKPARVAVRAQDPELAQRLWRVAEDLTGVRYLD